jgi:hypothetical protein
MLGFFGTQPFALKLSDYFVLSTDTLPTIHHMSVREFQAFQEVIPTRHS